MFSLLYSCKPTLSSTHSRLIPFREPPSTRRRLRQLLTVRSTLSADAATALVHALISSRVDYCNAFCTACAQLICVHSSGTEFLLVGLKKQLAKIKKKSSLNTTHSTRNLGFVYTMNTSEKTDKSLWFSLTQTKISSNEQ